VILLIALIAIAISCYQGEKLSIGDCYQEGIRYGHYWIWHLVDLAIVGDGHWGWAWAASGLIWAWAGSLTVRVNGCEPSQSQWRWYLMGMGVKEVIAIG
jgi:hypothetical protein